MNIFKWLKSKSGKLPITLAQAAGITAVVGAAGFGAMSFLSSPTDNNNTFLPPTAPQEQVVYVAQNAGGGSYEANGEVGSSFKAAPSRAIQLANQQAERDAQTRALAESSQQAPSLEGGEAPQMQAYQLTGADLGQGLGGGKNKDANGSLDAFSTLQNQLSGITQTINNAQQAAGQGNVPAPAPAGQNAAQLASASRNWGNGLTRAGGGGSGSSNSFSIQDSGKNARTRGAAASEMAQAGDAIAQAQAAMAQLQAEGGPRMRSQANFGRSEGFKDDKDARTSSARRFGNAKAELEFIRKKSAAIAGNKTNAANEGGSPFLASSKISGGLTVDGEQVTTGQSSNSSDFDGKFNNAMKGVAAKMASIQENMDERKLVRDELKSWIWKLLTVGLMAVAVIAALVHIAKTGPFGWWAWAAAGAATAAALFYIWYNTAHKIKSYTNLNDPDGWTTAGWVLTGVMTAGIGLAWFWGASKLSAKLKNSFNYKLRNLTGKYFEAVIKTKSGIGGIF